MADMRVRRAHRAWHEPAMPATWKERFKAVAKEKKSVLWSIDTGGKLVGFALGHLWTIGNAFDVIHFLVDPDEWRKGYGFDAALALHRYLFDYLDLRLATTEFRADNAAALRILAKTKRRSSGPSHTATSPSASPEYSASTGCDAMEKAASSSGATICTAAGSRARRSGSEPISPGANFECTECTTGSRTRTAGRAARMKRLATRKWVFSDVRSSDRVSGTTNGSAKLIHRPSPTSIELLGLTCPKGAAATRVTTRVK